MKCFCGKEILIDPEDIDYVVGKSFSCCTNTRVIENKTKKSLAGSLLNCDSHSGLLMPDHINRDIHDNRRCNLRLATKAENNRNRGLQRNNRSGLKGVFFRYDKWNAQISHKGEKVFLGVFDCKEEAAKAYDAAAALYHGEFAATNRALGLLSCP